MVFSFQLGHDFGIESQGGRLCSVHEKRWLLVALVEPDYTQTFNFPKKKVHVFATFLT